MILFADTFANATLILRPVNNGYGKCVFKTSDIGNRSGAAAVAISSVLLVVMVAFNLV